MTGQFRNIRIAFISWVLCHSCLMGIHTTHQSGSSSCQGFQPVPLIAMLFLLMVFSLILFFLFFSSYFPQCPQFANLQNVCMLGMMVAPNHKHVDIQGRCYLPYITSWTPSSNLVKLCESLSAAFNGAPPVFKVCTSQTVANILSKKQAIVLTLLSVLLTFNRKRPQHHHHPQLLWFSHSPCHLLLGLRTAQTNQCPRYCQM